MLLIDLQRLQDNIALEALKSFASDGSNLSCKVATSFMLCARSYPTLRCRRSFQEHFFLDFCVGVGLVFRSASCQPRKNPSDASQISRRVKMWLDPQYVGARFK